MIARVSRGEGWELAWDESAGGGRGCYIAGFSEQLELPRRTIEPATTSSRLVILFDSDLTVTSVAGGRQLLHSFVAGPRAGPVAVDQAGSFRGVEVGLSNASIARLIGCPVGELDGSLVSLDEMIGSRAVEVHDRLAAATNWSDVFAVLEQNLPPGCEPPRDERLQSAWNTIEQTGGRIRIDALADRAGWSSRHFADTFHRQFGLTPKIVARLFRFERATRLLKAGTPAAQTAAACGYFDQAHMNLDFADFGSCSPGQIAGRAHASGLESSWSLHSD